MIECDFLNLFVVFFQLGKASEVSNGDAVVKFEDRYYDREKREFLVHVRLTPKMFLVLESELQKKTKDEKEILFAANIISDEFSDFADICVGIIFGKPNNSSKTFPGFGDIDIKYQIYYWLKDTGERFVC